MTATLLQNFDPTTMTFGTDFEIRDGNQFGSVRLTMPILHFSEPLTSKYGINPNFEDNGRYPLELTITPEIEDHTQTTFAANLRTWFRKDKKSFTFSRMLRETDDGTEVLRRSANHLRLSRAGVTIAWSVVPTPVFKRGGSRA